MIEYEPKTTRQLLLLDEASISPTKMWKQAKRNVYSEFPGKPTIIEVFHVHPTQKSRIWPFLYLLLLIKFFQRQDVEYLSILQYKKDRRRA